MSNIKNRAVASSTQEITGSLNFYTLFTKIDIRTTGDYQDKSQKLFDNVITLISTRAQPVIIAEPYQVDDLEEEGSPELEGEGYVFKFVTEHEGVFANIDEKDMSVIDALYHLKYIFDGIEVEGESFHTEGSELNIDFKVNQKL